MSALGDALSFDPLDPALRYCVYCQADCWPEPENRQHAGDCPTQTGVYPILEQDRNPWGNFGDCGGCHTPFTLGDLYVLADVRTETITGPAPEHGYVRCLGCGATGDKPKENP